MFLVPKPVSSGPSSSRPNPHHQQPFTRKSGHLIPVTRVYKPKPSRGRRGRPTNRNMTLNNSTRPYQSVPTQFTAYPLIKPFNRRRTSIKRLKYSDKPCPRFTTTGAPDGGSKKSEIFRLLQSCSIFSTNTCLPLLCFFCHSRCLQSWPYLSLPT